MDKVGIAAVEALPIFYEWTENSDRVDSQATSFIRNRIAELKETEVKDE